MDIYSDSFWAAFGPFLIILLAILIIMILAGTWKIFSKAGKPGWAGIIPIYNTYILSNIVFGNAIFFTASMVVGVLAWIAKEVKIDFLSLITNIAAIVLNIFLSIKLSKAFGKSGGFIVGMIFLPFIFIPILGFGSAEYIGPDN